MKKILVVDDDPEFCTLVATVLTDAGYITETTQEWETIYRKAMEFRPELILLDIQLDGMDGRIVCKNLKNMGETDRIPVLISSSHTHMSDSVFEYGADFFLSKPFTDDQLLNLLSEYA